MAIRHMRIAWWIPKATDTHWEYVIFLSFHCSSWYANTPHSYYYTNIACLVNCRCSHRTVCRLQQGTSSTAAGTPGNVHGDWCETLWCVLWCHRLEMLYIACNFCGCTSIVYCITLSFLFMIDAHSVVSTHLSNCTSPSVLQTRPYWLNPLPDCPHLNHIQLTEMQPIISPKFGKNF